MLALCVSAALGAPAQHPAGANRWTGLAETAFQLVGRADEAPNSSAPTTVTQDGAGFIWIGTQNGLARWDGYRFRIFKSDPSSEHALPASLISRAYTDSRGRLWIGASSGDLARYDPRGERFVRYSVGPNGLSSVSIWDITDDGAGGVWVATEGGLDHVAAEAGGVSHLRHSPHDPGSLPDDNIRAVLRTRDGSLWVGTSAGMVRRKPGEHAFVPVPLPTSDGKVAEVLTFLEDTQQRLWIGTRSNGAYVIDPRDMRPMQVLESDRKHDVLRTDTVRTIAEVRPGEVWLGTVHGGIFAVDTLNMHIRRIRHDALRRSGLADDNVTALYKDRSGLVWVCTLSSVSLYDASQDAVYTIADKSSNQGGRSGFTTILQMPDGRLWLGRERRGLEILGPTGAWTAAPSPDPDRPETALPRGIIRMLARAQSGYVYAGTDEGLYRVDPPARHVTRLTLGGRAPTARVNAVLVQGTLLWVGGVDGLWKVDEGVIGARTHAALTASEVDGLSDRRVNVIEQGSDGSVWIGTQFGLNRLDPATNAVERIVPDARDPGALATGWVSTLLTDLRGRLWVGTFGQGIEVLEGRREDGRPRFRHLGIAQGLANENIDKLLMDHRGEIWASTDDGVAVIDPASFEVRTLRRAEGVAIPSYLLGNGAVTDAGELVFGGSGGLTVVRPERFKPRAYHPPVVVTDVHLGGKWVPSAYLNLSGRGQAEALTIYPGANSVAVEFAALDYSAPERSRYAYKLEGFDPDWTETDSARRLAAYTNLPPGDYLLRLRGSNRDGVWTNMARGVPVRVLPAWFQTLTFKLAASFALLCLLVLAYRLRIRYIAAGLQKRHQVRLAERDRIARELHDTLLQSTEGLILKVHSVVAQLSPESPQRARLTAALDHASELAYEGRERIQQLREGAPPRSELGGMLANAAQELGLETPTRFELKLKGQVRELRPHIWEELYRIGYEALWNAYRHAHAGLITVAVNYGDRELLMLISDDGRGIPLQILESSAAPGHFGLAGMRERARAMKARLHIESSQGAGTRVEIRINSLLSYAA